jgi:DnaJ family protein B protein 11
MQQHKVCDQCPNVKIETEYVELDVEVEPGMRQDQEIVFHGEGERVIGVISIFAP